MAPVHEAKGDGFTSTRATLKRSSIESFAAASRQSKWTVCISSPKNIAGESSR